MAKHITYEGTTFEKINHSYINNLNINIITDLRYIHIHSHSELELIQILVGNVTVTTPKEEFTLHEGDVAFFSRYLPHKLVSDDEECTLLVIQIEPDFFSSFYPQIDTISFERSLLSHQIQSDDPEYIFGEIKHICFDLAYNYYAQKLGFEFRCVSDVNRIFGFIVSCIPHHYLSESDIYSAIRTENRMTRVLSYIDQHFSEKISLSEIAEKEGLSVQYLSQMFHQQLNMTFQDYLKGLRFERAVFLLSKTGLKLYDICIESGFSDPKYLNAAFKEVYGVSPSQFRKKSAEMHLAQNDIPSSSSPKDLLTRVPFEECIPVLRRFHKYHCDEVMFLSAINISK